MGLSLVAFALRIYHLNFQSLWRDEVDAIRFSSPPFLTLESVHNILGVLTQTGHNGPLYFVALRGWRTLTGDSEFALRYFSLLGGVLMVALTYQAARRLKLGPSVAMVAALLVGTSPYALWYSQEAKMYTWLACLVLFAVYAYQSALSEATAEMVPLAGRRRWPFWWALFVVTTSLSFYLHILSPLMLPVYVAWGLMQWPGLKAHWRGWLISMGMLTMPYLPLLWWQAPLFINDFHSGHPFYPIQRQMSLLLHLYSLGVLQARFSLMAIMLAVFLALAGLMQGEARRRLQIGVWFITPPLLVFLISLRVPVFEDRYLIYILPAYYLLVALGLVMIARRERRLAWGLLALIVALNLWNGWRQATTTIKPDFRSAAHYLANAPPGPTACGRDRGPVIMFQMPYLQHTFAYYARADFKPLDGIWSNDNRPPEQVAAEMRRLTEGVADLWLVVSEEEQWDRRRLTRSWLDEQARLVDKAHFVNVDLYRYRFGPEEEPASAPAIDGRYKVFLPLVLCAGTP